MIKRLVQRSGNFLGYKLISKITEADYTRLTADIADIGQDSAGIRLLMDLEAFEGESTQDRATNICNGAVCGEKIARLAIVGDERWGTWLATFTDRFNYTHEYEFFPADEHELAWEWLLER